MSFRSWMKRCAWNIRRSRFWSIEFWDRASKITFQFVIKFLIMKKVCWKRFWFIKIFYCDFDWFFCWFQVQQSIYIPQHEICKLISFTFMHIFCLFIVNRLVKNIILILNNFFFATNRKKKLQWKKVFYDNRLSSKC